SGGLDNKYFAAAAALELHGSAPPKILFSSVHHTAILLSRFSFAGRRSEGGRANYYCVPIVAGYNKTTAQKRGSNACRRAMHGRLMRRPTARPSCERLPGGSPPERAGRWSA